MDFEVKDPEQFSDFPAGIPNDPTDELYEIKGNYRYLQVYAGMKHELFPRSRLRPSFSVGFVASKPLRQDLNYEYVSNADEYYVPTNLGSGTFSFDNLRVGIGADFDLTQRWSISSALRYQHAFSLHESESFPLRYWGVNLGVNYQLFKK